METQTQTYTLRRTKETNKIGEMLYAFIIGYVASITAFYILSKIAVPPVVSLSADMLLSLALGFFDVVIIALVPLLMLYRLQRSISLFLGIMMPLLINAARTLTLWLIQGSPDFFQVFKYPNVLEMWVIASLLGAGWAIFVSRPLEKSLEQ